MSTGKRNWNNFFLGLLVALSPWLGLPVNFKNFTLSIAGFLIMLFSLARLDSSARQARLNPPRPAHPDSATVSPLPPAQHEEAPAS